ncbi:hypothetical protein [Pareuzebyella sediminis]|uniref:hypothetical protein n=1 Tax=Pareuzebyella sediminis TaxID=2607998 RepID=UPI0011EF3983|nr:hypothetical protein [Pareuzebyella sediminis]
MTVKKLKYISKVFNQSNGMFSTGYYREYNEQGKLVKFGNFDLDENYHSEFNFDDSGNAINEKISISRSYGFPSEKRRKKYEYHKLGYRIFEYQTEIIDDSRTTTELKGGLVTAEELSAEYPRDVNNLLSIEDINLNNDGTIQSRKITNLTNNEIRLIEYDYKDQMPIRESMYVIEGQTSNIKNEKLMTYAEEEVIKVFDTDDYPGKIQVLILKTVSYHSQKESPSEEISKFLYTINPDKTIDYLEDITNSEFKVDERGNIARYSEIEGTIIYVNDYLLPDNKQLITVHEIMLYEDSHRILSKKYFEYFD